jgi:hypothetical protein
MGKLFDLSRIDDDLIVLDDFESRAISEADGNLVELGKMNEEVEKVFSQIDLTRNTHFVTCGNWSSHDLLCYLLQKTGPADVLIATWSMSEPAALKLFNLLENRLIKSLRGVIDWRVKNRHPAAFQLSQSLFAQLYLTTCHAKVTVIMNDDFNICINGSANYTNNPRIEAGVISVARSVAEFHASWITGLLSKSKPFELG